MRRLPEQMLSHRFKMRAAALHLLADRMNIAEAPLKRIVFENRGGAGFLIDGFHYFTGRLNGEGGSQADRNPLIIRHLKPRFSARPTIAQRFQQLGFGEAWRAEAPAGRIDGTRVRITARVGGLELELEGIVDGDRISGTTRLDGQVADWQLGRVR